MYVKSTRMQPHRETEQDELRRYFLNPASFDPDKLTKNELHQDDGKVFARIPRIPGRIFRRKKTGKDEYYIELIIERVYDREARQSRNKKVIIGDDVSWLLRGMMCVNDNYYEYFDHDGSLKHPLPGLEQAPAAAQPEKQPGTGNGSPLTAQDEQPRQSSGGTTAPAARDDTPKGADRVDPRNNLKPETERLQEQRQQLETERLRLEAERRELEKEREELARQRRQLKIQIEGRDDDHIRLLDSMLTYYIEAIDAQTKRRADKPMRLREIRTINDMLSEIRTIFAGTETEDYLQLAAEPDPDSTDPDTVIGTTYGEMCLILIAYSCTIHSYRMGNLWYKKTTSEEQNNN